jgi:alpha-L-fucosidase 2
MTFGGARHEQNQPNEISLWTGDEKDTFRYQDLGDRYLDVMHGSETAYRRQLDLSTGIHTIEYSGDGVTYHLAG